jgi:bifunctional UDP-N-acetylglucosamine pyrophosphorylase/glucosamine-1-phosphate N-acetyltransferase
MPPTAPPPPSAALILAAGQGKRMQSDLPKVLHPCADLPLVAHVIRLAKAHSCSPIVVVVSPANQAAVEAQVRAAFPEDPALRFAVQQKPAGTGDAARAGLAALGDAFSGTLCILYGDVPLLQAATLDQLAAAATAVPLAFLSARLARPAGYGRVVRDASGQPTCIVEDRDCSPAQRALCEVNAGVYLADAALLRPALAALRSDNAQGEYYLTDVVAYAAAHGGAQAVVLEDHTEIHGVNSRAELVVAERLLQGRLQAQHSAAGVSIRDPQGSFIGADVQLGRDVELGMGVQLRGRTRIGNHVRIDGPCVVQDSRVGDHTQVHSFSHLHGAVVGEHAVVGPFARLRPQAVLEDRVHVGNFVEVKKSRLKRGAKANHLTYLGDAEVGAGSNIGAGTITCNYDGSQKHRTVIGDNAFVGSHATLVAPLQVGDGAFVAAGSVLTQSVPPQSLAIGRAPQVNKHGYAEKLRARMASLKQKDGS